MRFNTQVHELSLWPHHRADGLIRAVLPYPPASMGTTTCVTPSCRRECPHAQISLNADVMVFFTAEAIPLISWLCSYDVNLNLLGYLRSSFPKSFSRMVLPLNINMKLHTVPEAQSKAISWSFVEFWATFSFQNEKILSGPRHFYWIFSSALNEFNQRQAGITYFNSSHTICATWCVLLFGNKQEAPIVSEFLFLKEKREHSCDVGRS